MYCPMIRIFQIDTLEKMVCMGIVLGLVKNSMIMNKTPMNSTSLIRSREKDSVQPVG